MKSFSPRLAASVAFSGLLAATTQAALKGRIVDTHSGEGVDSAVISLKVAGKTTWTDGQGRFDFTSVPTGLLPPGGRANSGFSANPGPLPRLSAVGQRLEVHGARSPRLEVLDARGARLPLAEAHPLPVSSAFAFDLSFLPPGRFFLRLNDGTETVIQGISKSAGGLSLSANPPAASPSETSAPDRTGTPSLLPSFRLAAEPVPDAPIYRPLPIYQAPIPMVLPPLPGIVNDTVVVIRPGYVPLLRPVNSLQGDSLKIELTSLKLQGMVQVPAGTLKIGESSFAIRSFFMDSVEVTAQNYASLVGLDTGRITKPALDLPVFLNRPIDSISIYDAVLYCNQRSKAAGLDTVYTYSKATRQESLVVDLDELAYDSNQVGFRLPTQQEWTYAALAGKDTDYFWGQDTLKDTVSQYAWYRSNAGGASHAVGTRKPNAWGLYDMSGNVAEWVYKWTQVNLPGPGGVFFTVQNPNAMGGHYNGMTDLLSPRKHNFHLAGKAYGYVGFRAVLNAPHRLRDILLRPVPRDIGILKR